MSFAVGPWIRANNPDGTDFNAFMDEKVVLNIAYAGAPWIPANKSAEMDGMFEQPLNVFSNMLFAGAPSRPANRFPGIGLFMPVQP